MREFVERKFDAQRKNDIDQENCHFEAIASVGVSIDQT
jgi:hypothetical protein